MTTYAVPQLEEPGSSPILIQDINEQGNLLNLVDAQSSTQEEVVTSEEPNS